MYRVIFAEFKSGEVWGELPVSSVDFSRALNAPGKATLTVPLANDPMKGQSWDVIQPWRILVYIQRGTRLVFGGPLVTWSVDMEREEMTLNCEGLWSYYRRRCVNMRSGRYDPAYTPTEARYVDWDQADIVYSLLRTQADRPDDTGGEAVEIGRGPDALVFDWAGQVEDEKPVPGRGVMQPTGVTRTRSYYWYEYKNVGEAVEQMAAVIQGFNFRIDHYWNGSEIVNHFKVLYPASGEVSGLELEHGVNCDVTAVTGDGTNMLTQGRTTGAGEGSQTLIAYSQDSETENALWTRVPRMEAVESHMDVTRVATLQAHADRMVREGSKQVVVPQVRLHPDAFPAVEDVNVGQVVGVRVGLPWWPGNKLGTIRGDRTAYLVTEIDTKVDGNGEETTLTLVPADLFEEVG
jgi:hypothetical protein